MRAICAADMHGDVDTLVKLRNAITGMGLDYVFLLGDYSRGFNDPDENRRDITRILDILSDFNVKAIPGNCDYTASVDIFQKRGVNC